MDVRPILVTGGTGQVATALEAVSLFPLVRVGRPSFDFDRPDTIRAAIAEYDPWLVVNAAAYTAVDAAESDRDAAYRANRDGPENLAFQCAVADVPLIHISTDYVYDGRKGVPYKESDPVAPQSVYGSSKLAGDLAVLKSDARAIILRTSWVYSPSGKNFVRTILTAGKTRGSLSVVADQFGCPTAASDLATAILAVADRVRRGWKDDFAGVFHAAGSDDTSWYGLAIAVFEAAARHGVRVPAIVPIATADWPTTVARPSDSRLDCSRLMEVFNVTLPSWRESVARTVDAMLQSNQA